MAGVPTRHPDNLIVWITMRDAPTRAGAVSTVERTAEALRARFETGSRLSGGLSLLLINP